MPRPRKPARIHLRPARSDRSAVYVILDGSDECSTGFGRDKYIEAEKALARYIASKYEPPKRRGADLAEYLIAEILDCYLKEHAPNTARPDFIAGNAERIVEWWGRKTLADVRGQTCRDYVDWRTRHLVKNTSRHVTVSTARHELGTLRAAIQHYHREHGPLPAVPAVALPEAAPPRDRFLTRAEVARLLRAARASPMTRHLVRFILLAIYTGTRSGALRALQWHANVEGGWIDLEKGVMHRRAPEARETKKRQPPVRIPDRLLPFLRRWRDHDLAHSPQVRCVVNYGGRPIQKLRRSFASAAKRAGLGTDVVPHVLRHSAATWLVQSGQPVAVIGGFLGMSVQTLEKTYGHHAPDYQHEVANAMSVKRGSAQETPRKQPKKEGNSAQR